MAKMRTIKQSLEELKKNDPNCAISEWWIRQIVKNGKLPSHRAGNRYLINLTLLEEFLNNTPSEIEQDSNLSYGKLRKITP